VDAQGAEGVPLRGSVPLHHEVPATDNRRREVTRKLLDNGAVIQAWWDSSIIISFLPMELIPEDKRRYLEKRQAAHERFRAANPYIDLEVIEFPSDALSIKRLRETFPAEFFDRGKIDDGWDSYGSFFFPLGHENPLHLVQLHNLLSAERAVAEYAYLNVLDPYPSETCDEEIHEYDAEARKHLEELYVHFRLADSPETARLLIRHIEEQGAQQGKAHKDRESRAR
jgi:hypothetical protein